MKIKVSITDKFLWDLYKLLDKADDVLDFILSNKYRQASILTGGENPVFAKYRKEKNAKQFSKLVNYLKRNNYIKTQNLKGKQAVMLTKEGISKALRASFNIEEKKKRDDGKWIMLAFDIPPKTQKGKKFIAKYYRKFGI